MSALHDIKAAGRLTIEAAHFREMAEALGAALVAAGEPWHDWLIVDDLRWMEDQRNLWRKKAAEGVPLFARPGLREIPGCSVLAVRWNLRTRRGKPDKDAAAEFMRAVLGDISDRAPTAARQRSDSGPTADNGQSSGIEEVSDSGPTAARQRTDAEPNTRVESPTETASPPFRLSAEDTDPRAAARSPTSGDAAQRAMALRCIEAIRQRPVNGGRHETDIKAILAHWRAVGAPPLDEYEADLGLVAAAARSSPDPLFAHDIRAEGWAGGRDRSRSVATLCRRERWGDRLDAARAWDAAGRPTVDTTPARDPPRPSALDVYAQGLALLREQESQ